MENAENSERYGFPYVKGRFVDSSVSGSVRGGSNGRSLNCLNVLFYLTARPVCAIPASQGPCGAVAYTHLTTPTMYGVTSLLGPLVRFKRLRFLSGRSHSQIPTLLQRIVLPHATPCVCLSSAYVLYNTFHIIYPTTPSS